MITQVFTHVFLSFFLWCFVTIASLSDIAVLICRYVSVFLQKTKYVVAWSPSCSQVYFEFAIIFWTLISHGWSISIHSILAHKLLKYSAINFLSSLLDANISHTLVYGWRSTHPKSFSLKCWIQGLFNKRWPVFHS
jgi:hypothetical protein